MLSRWSEAQQPVAEHASSDLVGAWHAPRQRSPTATFSERHFERRAFGPDLRRAQVRPRHPAASARARSRLAGGPWKVRLLARRPAFARGALARHVATLERRPRPDASGLLRCMAALWRRAELGIADRRGDAFPLRLL